MATTTANPIHIGLEPEQTAGVLGLLTRVLADSHVLYIKTRNYHWNVGGPHFQELHKFFESQYTQLEGAIDETAERIRALGGKAPGTMTEFLAAAGLREEPGRYPDSRTMLGRLLDDHEAVVRTLREAVDAATDRYHDTGTADFLTGLMEAHEKMAWMLRAYLE